MALSGYTAPSAFCSNLMDYHNMRTAPEAAPEPVLEPSQAQSLMPQGKAAAETPTSAAATAPVLTPQQGGLTVPTGVIALDWGTTQLRAMRLDANGAVLEMRTSAGGVTQVRERRFAQTLWDCCGDWLRAEPSAPTTQPAPKRPLLVACGMIGSTLGWLEAPYAALPATLPDLAQACVSLAVPEDETVTQTVTQTVTPAAPLRLWIVPGLIANTPYRDVLRGEECKLFGAMRLMPELAQGEWLGVSLGTHAKWVHVRDGAVVAFMTVMTGELHGLLLRHSTIGQQVQQVPQQDDGTAFAQGVRFALQHEGLAAALFTARSRVVTGDLPPAQVSAYVSGLLTGEEVQLALRRFDLKRLPLVLLGDVAQNARLLQALTVFGLQAKACLPDSVPAALFALAQHLAAPPAAK